MFELLGKFNASHPIKHPHDDLYDLNQPEEQDNISKTQIKCNEQTNEQDYMSEILINPNEQTNEQDDMSEIQININDQISPIKPENIFDELDPIQSQNSSKNLGADLHEELLKDSYSENFELPDTSLQHRSIFYKKIYCPVCFVPKKYYPHVSHFPY